jgi:hypothetical protein
MVCVLFWPDAAKEILALAKKIVDRNATITKTSVALKTTELVFLFMIDLLLSLIFIALNKIRAAAFLGKRPTGG